MGESGTSERTHVERMSSDDLVALLRVSEALSSTLDIETVMRAAIQGACEVLRLETGAIYLIDSDVLILGATEPPLPPDFPEKFRRAQLQEHPHLGRCIETGEPLWITDTSQVDLSPAEQSVCDSRGLRSILYVPLCAEYRSLGAFIVGSSGVHTAFAPVDVDLCRTLAHQISLAVVNAQLHTSLVQANNDLSRAYEETLAGWAVALDMRDHETRGHADRVVELTLRLAMTLGIPDEDLEHVRRGARLHDIGKMVVPDSILLKPGPLDSDEWSIMHRHPEVARELLGGIEYLAPAVDIPFSHHERWDGTGYPRGLSGEGIPLAARIFAVVDVYDALTSDRPYRPAWSASDAIQHISDSAGMHFDPMVVEAFLKEMRTAAL